MTTPLTTSRLAEIAARAEAATKGPWFRHDFADPAVSHDPKNPTNICVSCTTPDHLTVASMGSALIGTLDEARANAAFIAHAREDVPALVAEVERLRAALEAVSANAQAIEPACDAANCSDEDDAFEAGMAWGEWTQALIARAALGETL